MSPDSGRRNRLLWEFRDELWGLLKKEAKGEKRSVPRQLEEILEERYRPDELSKAEIEEALKLAATRDRRKEPIEPTPRKTTKKRANGPPRGR